MTFRKDEQKGTVQGGGRACLEQWCDVLSAVWEKNEQGLACFPLPVRPHAAHLPSREQESLGDTSWRRVKKKLEVDFLLVGCLCLKK